MTLKRDYVIWREGERSKVESWANQCLLKKQMPTKISFGTLTTDPGKPGYIRTHEIY